MLQGFGLDPCVTSATSCHCVAQTLKIIYLQRQQLLKKRGKKLTKSTLNCNEGWTPLFSFIIRQDTLQLSKLLPLVCCFAEGHTKCQAVWWQQLFICALNQSGKARILSGPSQTTYKEIVSEPPILQHHKISKDYTCHNE